MREGGGGTSWIARWNGGLMPAKYRRDYSARLDWRWANSISGLGPRTKEFSGLGAGVVYRATCSNHATGENDETASLPPSTRDALLSYSNSLQPEYQPTTDWDESTMNDLNLGSCFSFFTFRGYLNFLRTIFGIFFFLFWLLTLRYIIQWYKVNKLWIIKYWLKLNNIFFLLL